MKNIQFGLRGFFALLTAAIVLLSLAGCGNSGGRDTLVSGDESVTDSAIVTEDLGIIETLPEEPTDSEEINLLPVFEGLYSYEMTERDTNGSYSSVHSVTYELENDDILIITEYETEGAAEYYASCFDKTGTSFTEYNDDGTITNSVIDYIAPIHLWQSGKYIISYCSDTGVLLRDLNEILGTEFAGAGSDYFRPEYAEEIISAINATDYYCRSYTYSSVVGLRHCHDIKSVCLVAVSNDEYVTLYEFEDEYDAMDEASRWAKSGATYYGDDYSKDLMFAEDAGECHMFRCGKAIVVYWSQSGDLLNAISSVCGYQFAGDAYDYDGEKTATLSFSWNTEKFGYMTLSEFPQYAVIKSADAFADSLEALGVMDSVSSETLAKYSEEWFHKNDMILGVLEMSSGSVGVDIDYVQMNTDGSVTVHVVEDNPEIETDDMAYWLLFIEVDEGKINPAVRVDITEELSGVSTEADLTAEALAQSSAKSADEDETETAGVSYS